MTAAVLASGALATLAVAMVVMFAVRARRDGAFAEAPMFTLQRWVLGTIYALRPVRIGNLPYLLWHSARDLLRGGTRVPDPSRVADRPDTFGGVCRDLSPETVRAAAQVGFYPWCHFGPMRWWTRRERMVLRTAEFRMSKNLRRIMRKTPLRVTFDQAFDDVIRSCAGRRKNRVYGLTWITPTIMRLYSALHAQGHAHSFEVWNADGVLVGGGYGLSVGRVFFTESPVQPRVQLVKNGLRLPDVSSGKVGLRRQRRQGSHADLGRGRFPAHPTRGFRKLLRDHGREGDHTGAWAVTATLAEIAEWEPSGATKPAAQPGQGLQSRRRKRRPLSVLRQA